MVTFLTVILVLLVLINMVLWSILWAVATDRNTAATERFILRARGWVEAHQRENR